jgi:hypothetical protein
MKPAPPVTSTFIDYTVELNIAPADLHDVAAAGKYLWQDARNRTGVSVMFLT